MNIKIEVCSHCGSVTRIICPKCGENCSYDVWNAFAWCNKCGKSWVIEGAEVEDKD
jgi:hypothetical protein